MKRYVIPFFLMAALASACSTQLHRHADGLAPMAELTAIDSLMWSQPDSAFTQLLAFADSPVADSLNTLNGHYFHLLLSELLYKNDYAQTNRDDLLLAMAYLDSLCGTSVPQPGDPSRQEVVSRQVPAALAFLNARSHYINGAGYYEMDSAVPACRQYLHALEMMETRFNEKDLVGHQAQFMALTYTHLTVVFSDQYLHEQAIGFGKQALSYYNRYDATPWHQAWISEAIGLNHEMLERLDSAFYYYQQAYSYLPDTIGLTYRDIKTAQVRLAYKCGTSAERSIISLKRLLKAADNEEEYCARCLTIGDVFYSEQQYDSAWPYLQKVFCETTNTALKKQAAEWLAHICKESGRNAESSAYSEFLLPFANQEENKSAEKSNLTGLYNEFSVKALANQHRQKMKDSITWTAFFIGGLLLMVSVFVILYHKKKEKLELLERQFQKMGSLNEKPSTMEQFLIEPICQEIIFTTRGKTIKRSYASLKYPELVLNESQLFHLALTVDRYFGPIENLLEDCGINLNPTLLNQCRLYLLGMDAKQIAVLLDKDYSSIKRYENKLKTLFKTQKDMVVFMRKLVLKK